MYLSYHVHKMTSYVNNACLYVTSTSKTKSMFGMVKRGRLLNSTYHFFCSPVATVLLRFFRRYMIHFFVYQARNGSESKCCILAQFNYYFNNSFSRKRYRFYFILKRYFDVSKYFFSIAWLAIFELEHLYPFQRLLDRWGHRQSKSV